MACGDPDGAKCVGTWTASASGVMALSEVFFFFFFFELLVSGDEKASLASFSIAPPVQLEGSLAWVLLCCLVHQAHRGAPLDGVLLCKLVHQALTGAPCVESYSVVQCIRRLMGQSLCCSDAGVL